jgi:hypothetical protein
VYVLLSGESLWSICFLQKRKRRDKCVCMTETKNGEYKNCEEINREGKGKKSTEKDVWVDV